MEGGIGGVVGRVGSFMLCYKKFKKVVVCSVRLSR